MSGSLTPRQVEILQLVANGYLRKQVPSILHVSEHTVRNHMARIMERLDTHGQGHTIAVAMRLGYIK